MIGYDDAADLIVVGLGANGSATLRALARAGVRAIGIDRFSPPHDRGSSHGETRITRLGEGADYVPLVRRSHELWRELEAETGLELLLQCGGLVLARRGGAPRLRRLPRQHDRGRDGVRRSPRGDRRRRDRPALPAIRPARRRDGLLRARRRAGVPRALRRGAAHLGARTGRSCARTRPCWRSTSAATPSGSSRTGAPTRPTAPSSRRAPGSLASSAEATRSTCGPTARPCAGTQPTDPAAYGAARFPVFIWMWGDRTEDAFYGFPYSGAGAPGLKVGVEQFTATVDPAAHAAAGEDPVTPAERAALYERQVLGRLRGVGPRCVASASCLYTASPDCGFVVDAHPGHDRIAVVSACSGHGFKHSAGLGETIAASAGGRAPDLAAFAFASRFTWQPEA